MNHQIAAANRSPTTVNAESLPGQQRRQRRRHGRRSVISVFDAVLLTSLLSPLTLGDGEGEGTRSVVSVIEAASSTSEVSDIIAIDGSLGGRASPRLPPSRRRHCHCQQGGGGGAFTYCCWSSGCFVAFVLDRAVLGETKLCQKWT